MPTNTVQGPVLSPFTTVVTIIQYVCDRYTHIPILLDMSVILYSHFPTCPQRNWTCHLAEICHTHWKHVEIQWLKISSINGLLIVCVETLWSLSEILYFINKFLQCDRDEGETGPETPGVGTIADASVKLNSNSDSLTVISDVSVTTKQMSDLYARSLSVDSGRKLLSRQEEPSEPETPSLSTAVTASKLYSSGVGTRGEAGPHNS